MSELYDIIPTGSTKKISHVKIKLREPVVGWTEDEQRVVIEAGTTFEVEMTAPVGQEDQ